MSQISVRCIRRSLNDKRLKEKGLKDKGKVKSLKAITSKFEVKVKRLRKDHKS